MNYRAKIAAIVLLLMQGCYSIDKKLQLDFPILINNDADFFLQLFFHSCDTVQKFNSSGEIIYSSVKLKNQHALDSLILWYTDLGKLKLIENTFKSSKNGMVKVIESREVRITGIVKIIDTSTYIEDKYGNLIGIKRGTENIRFSYEKQKPGHYQVYSEDLSMNWAFTYHLDKLVEVTCVWDSVRRCNLYYSANNQIQEIIRYGENKISVEYMFNFVDSTRPINITAIRPTGVKCYTISYNDQMSISEDGVGIIARLCNCSISPMINNFKE